MHTNCNSTEFFNLYNPSPVSIRFLFRQPIPTKTSDDPNFFRTKEGFQSKSLEMEPDFDCAGSKILN